MVSLLNALWTLLSLAAAWAWLRRGRGLSRYSVAIQLCSLACALIILFPVVSANDDLAMQQMATETSETQRPSIVGVSAKSARPCSLLHFEFCAPQVPAVFPAQRQLALLPSGLLPLLAAGAVSPFLNRPPPILALA